MGCVKNVCFFPEEKENTEADMMQFSTFIKVMVPEGMVVGISPENMQTVTWKYKVCDFAWKKLSQWDLAQLHCTVGSVCNCRPRDRKLES